MLNMMIDPKGKPYEVSVLDSSGNPVIDRAAVKAVDKMTFQPADRAGTPIDSSLTFKMVFTQELPKGASREFISTIKRFDEAIQAGDRAAADAQLAKLTAQNLYEDAYKGYGQYRYDLKWGTEADQLKDLRRAIAGEKNDHYLSRALFADALTAKFALEVRSKDYGSALDTWETLRPIVPDELASALQRTVYEINALKNSHETLRLPAQIGPGTSWHGNLFRRRFSLSITRGAVSEIKLRCKKQYVFFRFEPDIEYTVNSGAGDCLIEVVGDPGTIFELSQS